MVEYKKLEQVCHLKSDALWISPDLIHEFLFYQLFLLKMNTFLNFS